MRACWAVDASPTLCDRIHLCHKPLLQVGDFGHEFIYEFITHSQSSSSLNRPARPQASIMKSSIKPEPSAFQRPT